MILEHKGKIPKIHESAYVAPNATICGEVEIGPGSSVLFGAVLTAEGGPIRLGQNCIVMENAVLRASGHHPLTVGDNVLMGPQSYLTGCSVEDDVFVAAGSRIFNGARIGRGSEVRINGIVHLRTVLPPGSLVPIGWVAVGDPVLISPPDRHEDIEAVQRPLNFPKFVFGLDREKDGSSLMPRIAPRYNRALAAHKDDKEV